jgi:hypothetical protein
LFKTEIIEKQISFEKARELDRPNERMPIWKEYSTEDYYEQEHQHQNEPAAVSELTKTGQPSTSEDTSAKGSVEDDVVSPCQIQISQMGISDEKKIIETLFIDREPSVIDD